MNRKWLFAGALAAAVVMGVASPALADDYCASPYSRPSVSVDLGVGYGSEGYGYTRPYDSYRGSDYSRPYDSYQGHGYSRPYDSYQGHGYSRPYDSYQGHGYSRPYDSYDRGYSYDGNYGGRYYGDGYGRRGYGGRTVHEDHIRTTFNPFPLPHIDKRVVHHQHPAY